jgi:hypothetical protein
MLGGVAAGECEGLLRGFGKMSQGLRERVQCVPWGGDGDESCVRRLLVHIQVTLGVYLVTRAKRWGRRWKSKSWFLDIDAKIDRSIRFVFFINDNSTVLRAVFWSPCTPARSVLSDHRHIHRTKRRLFLKPRRQASASRMVDVNGFTPFRPVTGG